MSRLPKQVVSAHVGAHPPSQNAVHLFNFPADVRASILTRPLQELLRCRRQAHDAAAAGTAAAGAAPPHAQASVHAAPAPGAQPRDGGSGSIAEAVASQDAEPAPQQQRQGGGPGGSNGGALTGVHAAPLLPDTEHQAAGAAAGEGGGQEAGGQPQAASSGAAAGLEAADCDAMCTAAPQAAAVLSIRPSVVTNGALGQAAAAAPGDTDVADVAAAMDADMPGALSGPACNGSAAHLQAISGSVPAQQDTKQQKHAGASGRPLPESVQQVGCACVCSILLLKLHGLDAGS